MKKTRIQKILKIIRQVTPLFMRQKVGPIIAYLYYHYYRYTSVKKPNILSIGATLDFILKEKLSVIRFGDGEVTLIDSNSLSFQKKNNNLSELLEKVITSNHKKLLICIPGIWGNLDIFETYARSFIMHHLYRQKHVWDKLLSYTTTYGDAYITRHYLAFKDKSSASTIFKKFTLLWESQDVILIEGSKSRIGVGNDIFANVKSLHRILCPAEHAFSKYVEIMQEATKVDKDRLILIALGPTAKILAYDLFLLGYRVIDIGHIDMEYDMFIRKEKTQVKVPYKYFNEINERNPDDCKDEIYLKQIIATIE